MGKAPSAPHVLQAVAGELRRRSGERVALAEGDRPASNRRPLAVRVGEDEAPLSSHAASTVAGEVIARLNPAGGAAGVAVGQVAVVTGLGGIEDAVAAHLDGAAVGAAVA